jgi:hypothetical protein
MGRLVRWWHAPRGDKGIYARILLLMAVVELALRLLPLARVARLVGVTVSFDPVPLPSPARHHAGALPRAAQLIVDEWPPDAKCVRRALVLAHELRAAHAVVRLGAARAGERVRAHAWVELDGAFVGDDAAAFAPLHR